MPNKIHEREMDKADIPGTFNAGAALGPVNETNMARIWNKHKQSNTPLKRKVFVGLSGGVDSAVSAALLKERGFDVTGAFIKIWQPEFIECTWERDRLDAMRVAAHLDIPFYEVDLSEEYKRQVIDEMLALYACGETPNPDTLCNERIKFGTFFSRARAEGADFVATGHYARILREPSYALLRGVDVEKDQSYFLYTLSQEHLAHTFFPVGDMEKRDVRRAAERFRLPVAAKPDSQGLCFVGDVSMREFLSRYLAAQRGAVLDMEGRVVGEHEGAMFYTRGQRHGFSHDVAGTTPHYVAGIDVQKNEISISPRQEDALSSRFVLRDAHWVSGTDESARVTEVQVRYREAPARIKAVALPSVSLAEPRIIMPGQAAVFYNGNECLGGGIIHT